MSSDPIPFDGRNSELVVVIDTANRDKISDAPSDCTIRFGQPISNVKNMYVDRILLPAPPVNIYSANSQLNTAGNSRFRIFEPLFVTTAFNKLTINERIGPHQATSETTQSVTLTMPLTLNDLVSISASEEGVCTVTTLYEHGLLVDDTVEFVDTVNIDLRTTFTVLAVVDAYTFTITSDNGTDHPVAPRTHVGHALVAPYATPAAVCTMLNARLAHAHANTSSHLATGQLANSYEVQYVASLGVYRFERTGGRWIFELDCTGASLLKLLGFGRSVVRFSAQTIRKRTNMSTTARFVYQSQAVYYTDYDVANETKLYYDSTDSGAVLTTSLNPAMHNISSAPFALAGALNAPIINEYNNVFVGRDHLGQTFTLMLNTGHYTVENFCLTLGDAITGALNGATVTVAYDWAGKAFTLTSDSSIFAIMANDLQSTMHTMLGFVPTAMTGLTSYRSQFPVYYPYNADFGSTTRFRYTCVAHPESQQTTLAVYVSPPVLVGSVASSPDSTDEEPRARVTNSYGVPHAFRVGDVIRVAIDVDSTASAWSGKHVVRTVVSAYEYDIVLADASPAGVLDSAAYAIPPSVCVVGRAYNDTCNRLFGFSGDDLVTGATFYRSPGTYDLTPVRSVYLEIENMSQRVKYNVAEYNRVQGDMNYETRDAVAFCIDNGDSNGAYLEYAGITQQADMISGTLNYLRLRLRDEHGGIYDTRGANYKVVLRMTREL
jgi:hypothetical protein